MFTLLSFSVFKCHIMIKHLLLTQSDQHFDCQNLETISLMFPSVNFQIWIFWVAKNENINYAYAKVSNHEHSKAFKSSHININKVEIFSKYIDHVWYTLWGSSLSILNHLTMEYWKITVAIFPSRQRVFSSELLKLPWQSPLLSNTRKYCPVELAQYGSVLG